MKYIIFSALSMLLLISCQSDEAKQQEFAGQYQVTLHLPEAKNEMEKAKEDVEKELKKAKEEIETEIEKAKKEIESELGEGSHSSNAAGNFVEGIGQLAQGLAGLGEGLGKMGIDIGQGIIDGLKFKAEFKPDGTVFFGKRSKIQIGAGNHWEIRDGKFYLWEEGEEKKEFTMKKLGENKWDLTSSDIIFHLEKI
jgi:hypothetical protein